MKKLCPHCGKEVIIHFQDVEIQAVEGVPDWENSLTPEQNVLLESAERMGILSSVNMALQVQNPRGKPTNIRKFFLDWLRVATAKRIPLPELQFFMNLFPKSRITYVQANGIAAVLADSHIRWILPAMAVTGGSRTSPNPLGTGIVVTDQVILNEWIRTKRGYVAFEGAMLAQMRTAAIGELVPLSTNALKPFQAGLVGNR